MQSLNPGGLKTELQRHVPGWQMMLMVRPNFPLEKPDAQDESLKALTAFVELDPASTNPRCIY